MDDSSKNNSAGIFDTGGKRSYTPDFLIRNGDKKPDGQDKNNSSVADLKRLENKAVKKADKKPSLANTERNGGGLYNPNAKNVAKGKAPKKIDKKKLAASGAVIGLLGVLLIPMALLGAPMLMIGAIDFNLQESLGFSGTIAIIEQQGLNVLSELAANGEMPNGFAGDLANAGILVGQVTAAGDFVRTNNYIANIDDSNEIAATGFDYHKYGAEGELAFLFDNEVVNASNFVVAAESNPKLYAAYSEALDVSARFYYGSDVSEVYKDLGLTRGAFNGWKATGNEEADQESFNSTLEKTLNSSISSSMAGCDDASCDESSLSTGGDANEILDGAKRSSGDTSKAAQLLNSAISSTEPAQAAKAFLAIEEPIQRARIDGDGPVNQVMNVLSSATEVTYTDVNTQEETKTKKSILETVNFAAAVSGGGYSVNEANNFSRDRVLVATNMMDNNNITGTTVKSDKSSSNVALGRGFGGVDDSTIDRAKGSVEMSVATMDDSLFSSVVGGNKAVEGGSYLSNTINQRALGAMPSDAATIAKYQQDVDIALARKAEADRATLSPFDISSPHTFLGSIVHGFSMSLISHTDSGRGGVGVVSAIGAAVDLAGNSVNDLFGIAKADGSDQKFTTLAGNCATVKKVGAEGDLYCNSHNTISTKYMSNTASDWGSISESKEYQDFVKYGMDRETSAGVQSASVCERYRDDEENGLEKLLSSLQELIGVYQACGPVDNDIATGARYTFNGNNGDVEKYSAYALYDAVSALVKSSQSETSKIREEFNKKYPKDNSAAGRIARMSGMTKAEAELALNYASYLTTIANYNPLERFAFGGDIISIEKPMMLVEDEQIKENVYCYWCGKIEFAELRNRNYAV